MLMGLQQLLGIPVDCSIKVSRHEARSPPVKTIPSCDISAASSGGDSSNVVLTDLTINKFDFLRP